MRIEFLTQDDPLYILPFFDEFLRHYASTFEVIQVSCCPTMGKRSRTQLLKELTALYGPIGVTRLAGRAGISKALGKVPKGKDARRFHTLEQLCHAYRIPFEKIGNPNTEAFVESLRRRSPELLASVACPYILKQPILNVAPLGAINVHHAPLPRYKGMMPTFWQMFHNEKTVGVTVHYMSAKIDEGDALFQDQQFIEPGETLDHLIQRSKRHGAHCMAGVMRQIQEGSVTRIALDKSQSSYFTFPTS